MEENGCGEYQIVGWRSGVGRAPRHEPRVRVYIIGGEGVYRDSVCVSGCVQGYVI